MCLMVKFHFIKFIKNLNLLFSVNLGKFFIIVGRSGSHIRIHISDEAFHMLSLYIALQVYSLFLPSSDENNMFINSLFNLQEQDIETVLNSMISPARFEKHELRLPHLLDEMWKSCKKTASSKSTPEWKEQSAGSFSWSTPIPSNQHALSLFI